MDKWLYRVMIALVIIGLAVSVYMTIYKISGNDGMCLGSGDCSTVNASRFSEVNGIPVAVFGIVGYAAILIVLFYENKNEFFKRNGTLLAFGMSLTGFLFTLWLVYVELVLLKAICPFCVTSQVSMTLIFIIAVVRLFRNEN
ncbi:MAG TPA: vitamin K epoxide reductase family protein [Anaerolineales bacterium]|nr:vitamin K epoxide reductase family protein [Anaerolineales bacterium]HNE05780.1 vitamin K epoxide reductase family protein [Anaerolineales bacterium]HNF93231.1 vitamin K epoxide reductase family protein [Anaerolineales bacterium]HNH27668.1 vitamin K epoxide reductase family protein [Anaerolineales bacterium]HNM38398.1 vitamin K epoxide reductase family protein [Anaerolineales bacterium]